jgi:predicted secreted Zn-dependent protease
MEIAREFAQDVERGLMGLKGDARRDCDGMLAAAKTMMARALARHDRRQRGFDASWFGDGGQQFKYDRALIAAE